MLVGLLATTPPGSGLAPWARIVTAATGLLFVGGLTSGHAGEARPVADVPAHVTCDPLDAGRSSALPGPADAAEPELRRLFEAFWDAAARDDFEAAAELIHAGQRAAARRNRDEGGTLSTLEAALMGPRDEDSDMLVDFMRVAYGEVFAQARDAGESVAIRYFGAIVGEREALLVGALAMGPAAEDLVEFLIVDARWNGEAWELLLDPALACAFGVYLPRVEDNGWVDQGLTRFVEELTQLVADEDWDALADRVHPEQTARAGERLGELVAEEDELSLRLWLDMTLEEAAGATPRDAMARILAEGVLQSAGLRALWVGQVISAQGIVGSVDTSVLVVAWGGEAFTGFAGLGVKEFEGELRFLLPGWLAEW